MAVPEEARGSDRSRTVTRVIREAYGPRLRPVAATVAAGAALGFLIGGVGGRLAMRLLFLTSESWVRGVPSDDGFVIGHITAATIVLLILGMFAGVIGALAYVAIRPFLLGPPLLRWATCGLWAAATMGTLLVHTEGVDFTVLSPRWLAIALFVAIPGLFGALIGPAVERANRPDGWFHTASPWLALAPLVIILVPGPPLFLLGIPIAVAVGVHHLVGRWPRLAAAVRQPGLLWAGRVVWGAVAVVAAADLTRKAAVLL